MRNWRSYLFWLLFGSFAWFIIRNFSEVQHLAKTLAQGKWQWLAFAALLQVVYYLVYTGLYKSAFNAVEVESRITGLLPIVLGSLFVNVVAPTGGTAGAALFMDDASRRGQSGARTAAGTLVAQAADFSSFALILIVGLVYLFLYHDLQGYEIAGAAVLLLISTGLVVVLMLGIWKPDLLLGLLGRIDNLIIKVLRWLNRPSLLAEGWVEKTAGELMSAGTSIRSHPARLGRTLGIAMAAQVIDLSSLYILFLAFYQPISFGVLVAGFAIGVLFWIVSITPQGIGIVEGVMTLTFTSLGVPAASATAISLAFRGLTFWLPLAIGLFLLRRTKTFNLNLPSFSGDWGVRFVALLTAMMGIVNVISAITPSLSARIQVLERYSPLEIRHGSHLTAALAGFALLMLAGNLWRHKQTAWMLTIIVLGISSVSHLLKGLDYEEAILSGALALWLFSLKPHFYARSDSPSIRQGLRTLTAALGFTLMYGTVGFYLLDRQFKVSFGLEAAVRQTLVMFTQFYDPGIEPISGFGRYFAASIYGVGAVTIGYALLMLARPVLVRRRAQPEESERARQIVENYGRSSLARATLFDDKMYFFTPGGSMIAYAAKNRVAVALGDPIGPPDDLAAAVKSFQSQCKINDWQPAFYQTMPETLEIYHSAGFNSLKIGNEAIIDLASFTLEGRSNKGLRSASNHLTKLGYRARIYSPPLTDELLRILYSISSEWLSTMRGGEKHFSLGWFDDEYIRNSPVFIVEAQDGIINAFTNIIPEYTRNEVSIDLMRHRRDMQPGTMDFLFSRLLEWARGQGYATFNLGLSSLSGVGEHSQDPAIEKGLHYIYEHINKFYNFKGLHAFKEKFHPEWSPRYLIYPGAASLPMIAAALIRADSGDKPPLELLTTSSPQIRLSRNLSRDTKQVNSNQVP
jgi:phosphatidylglycerol lysyltransferase